MWRGSIHRQRDEGRHHLHPLQLGILLRWGDERALLAVLGREVVSEWAAVMLSGKEKRCSFRHERTSWWIGGCVGG